MPLIELAVKYNLTYVCQPDEFETGGHATGNLGHLFGCDSNSTAHGHMAAYDDVSALDLPVIRAEKVGGGRVAVRLDPPPPTDRRQRARPRAARPRAARPRAARPRAARAARAAA